MKSDDEIKADVYDYWSSFTEGVKALLEKYFIFSSEQLGIKIGGKGMDMTVLPDFSSLELNITRGIKDITSSDHVANSKQILGESIFNYDKFFYDKGDLIETGQLFTILKNARSKAIKQHKKQREELTRALNWLRNYEPGKHSPKEHKDLYLASLQNLEYLHKFSGAMVDYLTYEWPAAFGFDQNMDKDPAKHHFWNDIIKHGYDYFRMNTSPPMSHTKTCECLAELLGNLFPKIWGNEINKNASRIRRRIDELYPALVPRI